MGHNLLLRLSTKKQDVLRFLTNPSVPFTNNLAERDGRMMKLRQKISGGFRSADGAKDFAVRSVLSTARKQRSCMLHTLERRTGAPDGRAALGVTALTTWVVTYFWSTFEAAAPCPSDGKLTRPSHGTPGEVLSAWSGRSVRKRCACAGVCSCPFVLRACAGSIRTFAAGHRGWAAAYASVDWCGYWHRLPDAHPTRVAFAVLSDFAVTRSKWG